MRVLFLLAVATVGWLLYKMYFQALLAQGRAGRLKIGLIALGLVILALVVTGRAPAILALLGAALTMATRFAPLLLRMAPFLKRFLGPAAAGGLGGGMGGAAASGGRISQVRTATLVMSLDHDSGAMSGEVLAGSFAGRTLDSMSLEELQTLHEDCRREDHEALRLLEAWLVRERSDDWASTGASGAGGGDGDRARPGADSGEMPVDEAREVLGVSPEADRDEIVAAHRALMRRLHPDKGGSHYLATKVNEAKRVLLASLAGST